MTLMTKSDVKTAVIWLVSALVLSIVINVCAMLTRAHAYAAEPGDAREFMTSRMATQVERRGHRRFSKRHAKRHVRKHHSSRATSLKTSPAAGQSGETSSASVHVFPATAIQRGQFNEGRGGHRHAGIDLAGELGSSIVAAFSGRIIAKCKGCRDSGYGPRTLLVSGDDGIVYRYAHLSIITVKIGQRVTAGDQVGKMGALGPFGMPHLHFEMIPVAEYRRRPYGVHSLNPSDYLGGGRGTRMAAGAPMIGTAAHRYADLRAKGKVAGAR